MGGCVVRGRGSGKESSEGGVVGGRVVREG